MSHQRIDSFSFFAEQDPYKPQQSHTLPQHGFLSSLPSHQLLAQSDSPSSQPDLQGQFGEEPASEDPHSVQIPQTDFDPFYSDIVNLDSELDPNFFSISDLAVPEGIPQSVPGNTYISGFAAQSNSAYARDNGHERQRSSYRPHAALYAQNWAQQQHQQMPIKHQSQQPHQSQRQLQHQTHQQQPSFSDFAPVMRISKFDADSPSDPPAENYNNMNQFNESGSSPPSSPEKIVRQPQLRQLSPPSSFDTRPSRRPENDHSGPRDDDGAVEHTTGNSTYSKPSEPRRDHRHSDSLGISHTSFHRPRSSVIVPSDMPMLMPNGHQRRSGRSSPGIDTAAYPAGLVSPFMAPPSQPNPVSPYLQEQSSASPYSFPSVTASSLTHTRLPRHMQTITDLSVPHQSPASEPNLSSPMPPQSPQAAYNIPNLSPTLSDASLSPDPSSPEHVSEFSWQPIVTLPRSDHTEAIIEQQRKPKSKRKSRSPDGVVDEYVGTTDTEHVFVCSYPNCNRLFKRTYNLRSHIQTHSCDRPYTCPLCDANFVRPHDLRRHERCHSTAKPFVCPCGKGFNRQDAMQRHRSREICIGGISSGTPKSPKPRGRPKGRRNTPSSTPDLRQSESPFSSPQVNHVGSAHASSPAQFEGAPAQSSKTPELGSMTPQLDPPRNMDPHMLEPIPEGFDSGLR